MSKKINTTGVNDDALMATGWAEIEKSTSFYYRMALNCVQTGYLTTKQLSVKRQASFNTGMQYARSAHKTTLLSSSDGSTSRAIAVPMTADHHAPIQEVADSSKRINDMRNELELMQRKYRLETGGQLYAYMLTFTVPNCRQGDLDKTWVSLYKAVRKVLEKIDRDYSRGTKQTYILPAVDGTDAELIGSLVSQEITVNEDSLAKRQVTNLYHPHTHVVLLTDKPLATVLAKDLLFDVFNAQCPQYNLARKAFLLEEAYADNGQDTSLLQAAEEATKYAVKPTAWLRLAQYPNNDPFYLKTFAELFTVIHSHKAHVTRKLWRDAARIWRQMGRSSIASVFGFGLSEDSLPAVVTELVDLAYNRKTKRYTAKHNRSLTDAELLYYNRTLLSGLFSTYDVNSYDFDAVVARLTTLTNDPATDKDTRKKATDELKKLTKDPDDARSWLAVLQSIKIAHTYPEVISRLQHVVKTYRDNASKAKAIAISTTFSSNDIKDAKQRVYHYTAQAADLSRLIDALAQNIDLATNQVPIDDLASDNLEATAQHVIASYAQSLSYLGLAPDELKQLSDTQVLFDRLLPFGLKGRDFRLSPLLYVTPKKLKQCHVDISRYSVANQKRICQIIAELIGGLFALNLDPKSISFSKYRSSMEPHFIEVDSCFVTEQAITSVLA